MQITQPINAFNFEFEIERLVRSIDHLLTDDASSKSSGINFNKVLSAQIVNFGGEKNIFDVYNYCWKEDTYISGIERYFADPLNKSPLSGVKFRKAHEYNVHDDGIWYFERGSYIPASLENYPFNYKCYKGVEANIDPNTDHKASKKSWDKWCSLIQSIYPDDVNSIYLKKISIKTKGENKLYSGIFLSFNDVISFKNIGIISRICEDLLNRIAYEDLVPRLYNNITRQANRAAIADIINRNYAHHIGSHVSHRSSFEKILNRVNKKIEDCCGNLQLLLSIAYMRQKLENYKDNRSEFIAGITNPLTYQTFEFYKDVLIPFIENSLIIDNIAANEGIRFYNLKDKEGDILSIEEPTVSKLVIRCFLHKDFFGKNFKPNSDLLRKDLSPIPKDYVEQVCIYEIEREGQEIETFNSLQLPYFKKVVEQKFFDRQYLLYPDIRVILPGTLGAHAVYSLLENYIRNTAKHSYNPQTHKGVPVEIILKLKPNTVKKDEITFTITDNISDKDKVPDLREKITTPLSEKNGMGIADMKICSALLANTKDMTDEYLEAAIKCLPSNENISYELKLLKPQEVALIGIGEDMADDNKGIRYFRNLSSYINDKTANYKFAWISETCFNDASQNAQIHGLPFRMIVETEVEVPTKSPSKYPFVKTSDRDKDLLGKSWQIWLRHRDKVHSHLGIYLEQKADVAPTNYWKDVLINKTDFDIYYKIDDTTIAPEIDMKAELFMIYDRHGKLSDNLKRIKFIERHFYELIDKNNPDFDLIFSANVTKENFLLPYEMRDAALMNVLVIDERVAEVAGNTIANENHYRKLIDNDGGFRKYNHSKHNTCTIFDACWAANIYIATHFGMEDIGSCKPLVKEFDEKNYNTLKVAIKKNTHGDMEITGETNFMEFDCTYQKQRGIGTWKKNNSTDVLNSVAHQDLSQLKVQFDIVLIHRTKLKELLDHFGKDLFNCFTSAKVYVVTGGGTVDFIDDKIKVTILPTNILKDYVMGARPQKYIYQEY